MNAVRSLVRDRLALLGLLVHAGTAAVACIGVLMVVASLLPAFTAIAVAEVVRNVIEDSNGHGPTGTIVLPIAVVGSLLACENVLQSILVPQREWIANRVNGGVRQMVRQALCIPLGIGHLQDQATRDAAALPVDERPLFDVGAGAEGQLWLMARFVGAFGAAAVVAHYSLLAAAIALSGVVWQRSLIRRHYVAALSDAATNTTRAVRAKGYWSRVVGSPLGAKELRVFGANEWAMAQFAGFGKEMFRRHKRVIFGAFPLYWKAFLLLATAGGVPFFLLARAAIFGTLSAADLTAGLGGVVATAATLGGLGLECYAIEASVPQLAALRRLRRLKQDDRTRELRPPVRSSPTPTTNGPCVRVEGVSFRYPGASQDVLTGVDLDLHPGQVVAIVGENGSGKSTLLKLLAGFYTPSEGRILVDGHDLRELDTASWQNQIAIVLQDFTRFELTALENVALSEADQPDAGHAGAAAEQASAVELIDQLPDAWNTRLSRQFRSGIELSGGQWQRIALARAFYARRRGRRVVIMDEPTSNLDVSAETGLMRQLTSRPDGITVIASHRFSTVRHAHRIVVLEGGRVIEDGDHATLHTRGGAYARLYDLQASSFQESRPRQGERGLA